MEKTKEFVNPWCKIYIVFLVLYQLYFNQWQLPVGLSLFLVPTFIGIILILFSNNNHTVSNAGCYLILFLLIFQIIPLFFFLYIGVFFENFGAGNRSISFHLLLALWSIIYLFFGIFLYSTSFTIQTAKHTTTQQAKVFVVMLTVLFLGSVYFKGGPHISKAHIPDETPVHVKKEIRKLYSWNPLKRVDAAKQLVFEPSLSVAAIPFLISMLDDNVALSGAGGSGAQYTPGETAAHSLNKLGNSAADPLINALGDKNDIIRKNVILALNSNMGADAHNALLSCLTDENTFIRKETLRKLEWVYKDTSDPKIVPALTSLLNDKDAEVRIIAARKLKGIKDPRMIDPLIAALNDENNEMLQSVGYALQTITRQDFGDNQKVWQQWWKKNEEAFTEKYFIHEQRNFQNIIAYSLRNLRYPFEISHLVEALNDSNINTRKSAIWMLGKTGSPQAVAPLIYELQDSNLAIQKLASRMLFQLTAKKIGMDPEEWGKWWKWNEDAFSANKNKYIREHTEELMAALLSSNSSTQADAFCAAEQIGEPAVIPLIKSLYSSNCQAKKKAVAMLGRMGDQRAVGPLIGLLNDANYAIRASVWPSLVELTGKDFGENKKKWQKWWQSK